MQCEGTPDVSGLATATPDQTSGTNTWGTAVIRHLPKAGFYEEFTSSDFGTAGRWMTTNLSAKAYDGIQHSQHNATVPRTLQQHDGRTTDDPTVAFWAYPNNNRAIVTNEPASDEYKVNPHLGLLYTWDAATAGKGGDTGQKNIYNTSGGGVANEESGVPENITSSQVVNQQMRIQGICPAGWHLPSDYEWTELEQAIIKETSKYSSLADINNSNPADTANGGVAQAPAGQSGISGDRGTLHGSAMKEICENGTNASNPIIDKGFSALLVGVVFKGSMYFYGDGAYLWSSSSSDSYYVRNRRISIWNNTVSRGLTRRGDSYPVRCKKD